MNKSQKVTLCVVLLIVLLIAWGLFPLFFKWLMIGIGSKETALKDFGTFGDIYGSLNTLFTSATLIIVMYSAYLQRQANQDARKAMADQLRQARNATAQQLRQARNGLSQQLQQARESTAQQLELAQATHSEQMRESRHAIFATSFNIILNQKKNVLDSIYTGKEDFKPKYVFELLGSEFERKMRKHWSKFNHRNLADENTMFQHFLKTLNTEVEKSFSYDELTSYFYMYIPLLLLVKNSILDQVDKEIYYMAISHSMTHYEQVTLLWFITFSTDIGNAIKGTHLFDTSFEKNEKEFIINNFDQSLFSHPDVISFWKNN